MTNMTFSNKPYIFMLGKCFLSLLYLLLYYCWFINQQILTSLLNQGSWFHRAVNLNKLKNLLKKSLYITRPTNKVKRLTCCCCCLLPASHGMLLCWLLDLCLLQSAGVVSALCLTPVYYLRKWIQQHSWSLPIFCSCSRAYLYGEKQNGRLDPCCLCWL